MLKLWALSVGLITSVLLSYPVNAENVLYCQVEFATGFKKMTDGAWSRVDFKEKRYTVKFDGMYKRLKKAGGTFICDNPLSGVNDHYVFCVRDVLGKPFGTTFSYNKKSKRYVLTSISSGGYIEDDKVADTDSIHAGTCEKF